MKTFSLEDVISSMLKVSKCNKNNGQRAAFKAHATRRLNSYVARRSGEIGSKPSQIIAAVKAAVTKRKS